IDWIFDARTYGMRIRYTMTAAPTIDWVGDRISYQRIRFHMHELSDMLHGLVEEVRAVMGRLLMVEKDDFRSIPRIEWTKVEDDHSEDGIGYSFLQDDRNPWVSAGNGWVLKQMFRSEERQAEWVSDHHEAVPYRTTAVRQYGKAVETFREGMLTIMHMLGGMPARSWELLEMRHSNTAYGGVRNIIIDRGMVCFVTSVNTNGRPTA
ncbi:hypothetical protein V8F06_014191, partial [Rhypophila decipiens]